MHAKKVSTAENIASASNRLYISQGKASASFSASNGSGPNVLPDTSVIQREVLPDRDRKKSGDPRYWYSTHDNSFDRKYFKTQEKAKVYDEKLFKEVLKKRTLESKKRRQEAVTKKRLEHTKYLEENFKDYKPPRSQKGLLYKYQDQEKDDVPVYTMEKNTVKKYSEKKFADRKAGKFSTEVMHNPESKQYFALTSGTDIGLTEAVLRPDLDHKKEEIPLSRVGKPRTYESLANALDSMVEKYSKSNNLTTQKTRERIGKDIRRMSRGNKVKGTLAYTVDELNEIGEISAVIRLDKGRVPKATKYINNSITTGKKSFHDLFVKNEYVGAGSGGVEALRGEVEDNGEISEGSDIE